MEDRMTRALKTMLPYLVGVVAGIFLTLLWQYRPTVTVTWHKASQLSRADDAAPAPDPYAKYGGVPVPKFDPNAPYEDVPTKRAPTYLDDNGNPIASPAAKPKQPTINKQTCAKIAARPDPFAQVGGTSDGNAICREAYPELYH